MMISNPFNHAHNTVSSRFHTIRAGLNYPTSGLGRAPVVIPAYGTLTPSPSIETKSPALAAGLFRWRRWRGKFMRGGVSFPRKREIQESRAKSRAVALDARFRGHDKPRPYAFKSR